jgi:hypothetical protein
LIELALNCICCTDVTQCDANNGAPTKCTGECADIFLPFFQTCGPMLMSDAAESSSLGTNHCHPACTVFWYKLTSAVRCVHRRFLLHLHLLGQQVSPRIHSVWSARCISQDLTASSVYTPPCKIHTVYICRILQGGVLDGNSDGLADPKLCQANNGAPTHPGHPPVCAYAVDRLVIACRERERSYSGGPGVL